MIEIRETREQDAASVHRVHTAAFGRDAEADLVDALAADGALTLSLALAVDGEIVAQELRPGALPRGTHRVHYHDVFERV